MLSSICQAEKSRPANGPPHGKPNFDSKNLADAATMAPRVCEPSLDETIFGRLVSDCKVSAFARLSPLKADHLVIAVLYTRTKSLRLMDPKAKANDPVLNFYASVLFAGRLETGGAQVGRCASIRRAVARGYPLPEWSSEIKAWATELK